jgi:site-specific recombinase XerD
LKYLTVDQTLHLLGKITNPRDRAIFTTAYWRGLRASEVGLIQIGHWNDRASRLYVTRSKGGNSGEYLVSDKEARVIRAWVKDRGSWEGPLFVSERRTAISRQQLDKLMKRYAEEAELAKDLWHMHVLRHSIAVHLTEAGHTIQEIASWLGHRNITSTAIYAQMTSPARDAMAKSFYDRMSGNDKPKVNFRRNSR